MVQAVKGKEKVNMVGNRKLLQTEKEQEREEQIVNDKQSSTAQILIRATEIGKKKKMIKIARYDLMIVVRG